MNSSTTFSSLLLDNSSSTGNWSPPLSGPPVPATVWTIRTICIPVWVVIIVFGVMGNILTVRVLRSKKLRTSSTSLYLIAVALVDFSYLICSLSINLIDYIFLFPSKTRNLSPIYCRLSPMLHYSLTYMSVWLLVAVTLDRMVWVVLPFDAKKICTRKNAGITIAFLVFLFSTIDLHFFWTMSYSVNMTLCLPRSFTKDVYPYIDLLLMGILPFVIMIVANSLIIYKLRTVKKIRDNNLRKSSVTLKLPTVGAAGPARRSEKHSSLTTMLLSINIFFMASITPLLVYDILFFAVDLNTLVNQQEERLGPIMFGVEQMVYTLWYLNFSIHFLLYCMSGPKFRAEALKLFGILESPGGGVGGPGGAGGYQSCATELPTTYNIRKSSAQPPAPLVTRV